MLKIFLRNDVEVEITKGQFFARLRRAPVGGFIVPLNALDLDTGHVLARLEVQVPGLDSAFLR